MIRLAHIVNPYDSKSDSDRQIQDFTLQSMQQAKSATKNAEVSLHAAILKGENPKVDETFQKSSLEHSVLDIAQFQKKIPFTLIGEIIDHSKKLEADYIIYTNMDIILQPYFYDFVAREIEKGHDALIVNRRRVSLSHLENSDLPQIHADTGKSHPGYDCFVVKKELLGKFILKDICVGIPFIGVSLLHNIFAFATNYKIISHHHLTSHIGLQVMGGIPQEYYKHNYAAFQKIRSQLKPYIKRENLPFSELPFYKRVIAWGLNPSTPILLNLEIEGKGFFEKTYFYWNELRFKILDKVSSSN
jgi:hypothetical protein